MNASIESTPTNPTPTKTAKPPIPRKPLLRRASIRALIAGTLLAVVLTQPAAAVTWVGESRLTATANYHPTILRTGATSAISIWQHGQNVYARRTGNGGSTWASTQTLVTGIWFNVSAASSGMNVDLAYVKQVRNADGSTSRRLYYKRSTNGGATFGSARAMTSTGSNIGDQAIARHSAGQVSIAWTGLTSGNIYMRTSIDGGATFGAARYVGHSNNSEVGRVVIYRGDLQLAIGTGVTYIAYSSAHDTLAVRRTLNRGVSWTSAKVLNTAAGSDYSLVASGSKAVIGYTTTSSGAMVARMRRTTDKGTTWSASKPLVGISTGTFSARPAFSYRSGVLAVVVKYGTPGNSPVWSRESTDFGTSWSARTRVSLVHFADSDPEPAGIAILGTIRLAGYNENRSAPDEGFWVRRSQ
jgi:hypothetical protein